MHQTLGMSITKYGRFPQGLNSLFVHVFQVCMEWLDSPADDEASAEQQEALVRRAAAGGRQRGGRAGRTRRGGAGTRGGAKRDRSPPQHQEPQALRPSKSKRGRYTSEAIHDAVDNVIGRQLGGRPAGREGLRSDFARGG